MKTQYTKSYRALLKEYNIDQGEEKKVMPKKKPPTKISITRMTDEDYSARFPEAWEIYNFFHQSINNVGNIFSEVNKRKSKYAAYELAYATDLVVPIEDILECIKWGFSPAKMNTWLRRTPFNHIGTFTTYYNYWNLHVKNIQITGRLSEFRD